MAEFDETDAVTLCESRPVDEHANLVTHGLGLLLSVMASLVLMSVVLADGDPVRIAACGVYCFSLIGLYAASTLSHMFHDLAWRRFFRTLDQAFIFLLIAGSFTPVAVVLLRRDWWPLLPIAMWGFALFGVMLVLRVRNLSPGARFSYGLLGWMPVVSLKTLYESAPLEIFVWFVAGGLFYSVGTVCLRFDRQIRYLHALWHTFVIAGSSCHYIAILRLMSRL